MKTIMILLSLFALSCTDAQMGKVERLGQPATVRCFSGGQIIFEGRSTGAVHNSHNSDGYFFKDASDGFFKEVSGECVVVYD